MSIDSALLPVVRADVIERQINKKTSVHLYSMNKLIFIRREKDVLSHSSNQFHTGMFPVHRRIAL